MAPHKTKDKGGVDFAGVAFCLGLECGTESGVIGNKIYIGIEIIPKAIQDVDFVSATRNKNSVGAVFVWILSSKIERLAGIVSIHNM